MKANAFRGLSRANLFGMAAMIILSLTGIFGLDIGIFSVCVGVILFFLERAFSGRPLVRDYMEPAAARGALRDRSTVLWMLLPAVIVLASILTCKVIWPAYFDYLALVTPIYSGLGPTMLTLLSIVVLALGKEIAFRGYFQCQLSRASASTTAIVGTAFVFALIHSTGGALSFVVLNVLLAFVAGICYGYLFEKTQNVWPGAISHVLTSAAASLLMTLLT